MKTFISLCISSIYILFTPIYAQVLDEETGFIYVKAEYLYETGRYEEAITNFNLVITKDAKYKDALLHRGHAKFALGAYKGAKMDAMQSIDIKGITSEASALLGRSFSAMKEIPQAINSFNAAIAMDTKNVQYYEWRAAIYEDDGQILKACTDYEMAMNLGSFPAETKAKNLCGISRTKPKQQSIPKNDIPASTHENDASQQNSTTEPTQTNPNEVGQDEILSSGTQESGQSTQPANNESGNTTPEYNPSHIEDSEPVIDENLPKNDDSVNSFVIDEDLTISISGQELGIRKIKEIPSILILADENGRVSVNICVNKEGVVTKAEFNGALSTIAKKSLVSLALRKAKEFEFTQGKYDLQCGVMIFNIKGS